MVDSLHVIASRRLGGAERFFIRLIEALNKKGHEAVAVFRKDGMITGQLDNSVRRIHIGMRNNYDLFSVLKLREYINKESPPIVQTYMGRATRLTRINPEKGTIHIARLGGFYKIPGYYRHAHAWIGNTRGICDHMASEGIPADRIFLIGNFVDIKKRTHAEQLMSLHRSLEIPEDAVIIFSLARFIRKKGIDDLLTAFSGLPVEINHRPLRLVIAGDGPREDSLKIMAKNLGLDDRVTWTGWQNKPDIYFDMADLFVCPSRHEPLGNVILEAWAHRLPVVTTSTDGAIELVIDGHNGILTPLNSPKNMGDRILDLLKSGPEEWSRIGSNGVQTLLDKHSRDTVVKAYLELYDRLQKYGHKT